MKTAVPLVAFAAFAAAQDAFLFTIDQEVVSSSTAMIDSTLASAIIARRRGLTDDRDLGIGDESLLEDLNAYGGYQAPMFGIVPSSEQPGKLFIRFSGVDMTIDDFDLAMPDLWIQGATKDLLTDFKAVSGRKEKDNMCEYTVPASLNSPNSHGVEVVFTYPLEKANCLHASELPNLPVILSLHSFLPASPSEVRPMLSQLIRVLKHFSATENVESTVLVLPSKLAKPTHAAHHTKHSRRQLSEEELLELDIAGKTPLLPEVHEDPIHVAANNTNFTLPAVIPQCFTSQSACENTTNTCSGHGKCYLAHNNCYKCKCHATLARVNEDGSKKTVEWGGAACQKKDISVPFILFASFGVFMTAVVTGVIGMMYSMGAEELPSVIGAGVAGPKAGK